MPYNARLRTHPVMPPQVTDIILLVEDSDNDAQLTMRAFGRSGVENRVRLARDGEEAIAYLTGLGKYTDRVKNPLPAVILLDLSLPKFNGYQLMRWLRTQPEIKRIPVVVLSESHDPTAINRAYDAGASSYLVISESSPLGRWFREADKDIEPKVLPAQILDLLTFHDLDATMAC